MLPQKTLHFLAFQMLGRAKNSKFRFWIIFFFAASHFFAFSAISLPGEVSLAWDPSTSEGVIGYKVHYGHASGQYSDFKTVTESEPAPDPPGPTETTQTYYYTVTGLDPGLYYFAVSAFDADGNESGFSNEVFTTVPGDGPIILGSLVSKRFFGAVVTCTTDVDTSAIIRYKPSDGNHSWTVNIVTEGARRKNHTAMLTLHTGGQDVYYKYQWEVTDAEGKTTIKEGIFLANAD
jgi:hypothetical protein